MTIRKRMLLVIIFVFMSLLLIPVIGYLIYVQPFKTKTVTDVQKAPPVVIPELQKIMEAEDRDRIDEPGSILAVIYDTEGFIYINPLLRDKVKQRQTSWKNIMAELQVDSRWNRLAISSFSFEGKGGLVFFNLLPSASLALVNNNLFSFLLIVTICLIIIPMVIASLFLLSLRKNLNTLAREAGKIKLGTLDFALDIPKDKELAPLFISFDKMRNQLIEDNAQKSRFLMAISHDLKTPLTSIKGYLEAFNDGMAETKEEQDKYWGIIKNKADMLEQRIVELIEFAWMETVSWQKKFIPLDLTHFLKELSAVFAAESDIHGKQYNSHIELNEKIMIKGDRQLLQRALENIFDNAVRYTEQEVSIKLNGVQKNKKVIISISDSGEGIHKDDIPFIFEPFYRGSRGRNEKGFGLGLASVKSIIEAHGGTIDYQQNAMGGAEFIIILTERERG